MKTVLRIIQLAGLVFLFLPTIALAGLSDGTILIVGAGEAARAPEFARLHVRVTSICYETSKGAKDANAALASPIVDILRGFQKAEGDKVTASGGPNLRQTETIPVAGGQYKVLCERKWRAENTLTLFTSATDLVAHIQDALLEKIDAEAASPDKTAQTFAELGQPGFGLKSETVRALKIDSQRAAWEDAKLQLEAFAGRCELKNLKLIKISPPQHSMIAKYADGTEAQIDTPILPDHISVRSELEFTWTFDPVTMNCSGGHL